MDEEKSRKPETWAGEAFLFCSLQFSNDPQSYQKSLQDDTKHISDTSYQVSSCLQNQNAL